MDRASTCSLVLAGARFTHTTSCAVPKCCSSTLDPRPHGHAGEEPAAPLTEESECVQHPAPQATNTNIGTTGHGLGRDCPKQRPFLSLALPITDFWEYALSRELLTCAADRRRLGGR
eukprot:3683696-Rhodomonas_salina.1